MDNVLENALKRKKELHAELSRLDSFIEMYNQFAKETASIEPLKTSGLAAIIDAKQETKKQRILAAVDDALRESQPLNTAELLGRLRSVNVIVGGKDESTTLSSYLSKSGRFEARRKDGGWFLVGHGDAPQGENQEGHST